MQQLKIEQIKKSNFARRATLQLGQKLITLPAYGTLLKKPLDLNTLLDGNLAGYEHLQYICGPIHLLGDMIQEHEQRRELKNVFDEPVEKNYLAAREKIWFEDTTCDDLYYASFDEKLKDFTGYSKEVRDFLKTIDQKNYSAKFRELHENKQLFMKFITETVDLQIQSRMDFVMPPTPLLLNDTPHYMVNVWYDIVKTAAVLADTKADKAAAIYLVVHANNFKKPELLDAVLTKMFDEATQKEIAQLKFLVLKVVDESSLETETAGMRIRYREFIASLSTYCSNTGRTLIMMDSNTLGLASISLGVDAFIEPMNGVTGISFRRSKDKHGRYYHPEGLKFDSFDDIKQSFGEKSTLPCNCRHCSILSVDSLSDVKMADWWRLRRSHLVAARNEEVKEYHEAIQQDIVSNAITDKIQRSDVKNFLDFLPK